MDIHNQIYDNPYDILVTDFEDFRKGNKHRCYFDAYKRYENDAQNFSLYIWGHLIPMTEFLMQESGACTTSEKSSRKMIEC